MHLVYASLQLGRIQHAGSPGLPPLYRRAGNWDFLACLALVFRLCISAAYPLPLLPALHLLSCKEEALATIADGCDVVHLALTPGHILLSGISGRDLVAVAAVTSSQFC